MVTLAVAGFSRRMSSWDLYVAPQANGLKDDASIVTNVVRS